jgi:superfamily I DNA/RNA helicase
MPPSESSASLNPDQARAAQYGAAGSGSRGPLLIIAGAGSGKTPVFVDINVDSI